MMLSGIRSQKCASCPRTFAFLLESERRECIRCEQDRKSRKRRQKESKSWHEEKREATTV
jgi:hypothetical protein